MHDHTPQSRPLVHTADAGEALWFLGVLAQIKVTGEQSNQAYEMQVHTMPPGFGPPPHVHAAQDEAFFVLEGAAQVLCGERHWDIGPGSMALLPRGIRHGFTVTSETPLKMMIITSPALPQGFNHFVATFGEPAGSLTIPPFTPPDIPRLVSVSREHHIEYVPPLEWKE
jgi:mannose-6-phosphate isomerase-like protein (cupin superfamily)